MDKLDDLETPSVYAAVHNTEPVIHLSVDTPSEYVGRSDAQALRDWLDKALGEIDRREDDAR